MTLQARLADLLLAAPARSEIVYRIARRIVARHRGENDYRMTHNGELRLLRQVLGNCRVVLDVGANVGQWSAAALAINPSLELHCFEPGAAAFARLKQNVAGARLNNAGVGARPGSLEL